jgi:hypothetical protein
VSKRTQPLDDRLDDHFHADHDDRALISSVDLGRAMVVPSSTIHASESVTSTAGKVRLIAHRAGR